MFMHHPGVHFDQVIRRDDNQPLFVESETELQAILDTVWISEAERDHLNT